MKIWKKKQRKEKKRREKSYIILKGLHWNPLIDIMYQYGEVRLISNVSTLMHMGKNNRFSLLALTL